jgi:molybdopterin-guanine dinucleotide biosynthesis protein A
VPVDVVVLAGGEARRFGADKVALLLDPVLDSVAAGLGAELGRLVCVGPHRATARTGVVWTREEPALGGPLAGLAAGLAETSSAVVVVVGGDMPDVGRAVPALVAAVTGHDAAVLVDAAGRAQPLAAAWDRAALARRVRALEPVAGRPLRLLLDGVDVVPVSDAWGAGRDVDVPEDLP